MRLWSLHPRYLDAKGLVALWREALLAQAVLSNKTRGYKHHPQLLRFKQCKDPRLQIANYLHAIYREAVNRGYRFDKSKLLRSRKTRKICVTKAQLEYEWTHLKGKLKVRASGFLRQLERASLPEVNPHFRLIAGPIAKWEIRHAKSRSPRPK